jgi:signal transduction histidine kinase
MAVFLVLGITAWVVTDILRKPLDRFLQDVRPFAELEFDTPFRDTSLPELKSLTGQMEQIRLTLKRYQRINVEQIITQEQRNRMLMTHASVLVGHFDESGTWLFRNEAMTALFAQVSPENDLVDVNALLGSEQVTLTDDTSTTAVRDAVRIENRHFDMELKTPDEMMFVLRGHMLETYASDGSHLGGFLLLSDITQDREIDRMRTEMIHIIVHELQNPVAAVRGFLEILREEELSQEELTEIYALCARSVETLRTLIDRFLDITRLESGKLQIDMEPVVLTELLTDVIASFKPQLKDKQIDIEFRSAKVPVILGSQSMLEDVARNLISNAIKYGNPNRTIEVDLGMEGADVVFSVTDHGFGIPEEHRDKMFQKFYRIKAYNRQKGNGLGLAYVKEVVHKHNGTITFESNPEIGTRFIVRLPQEMGE